MIFTARQLEEMLKSSGRIVLPYRARLTPLAQDWIRQKKIEVGYSDIEPSAVEQSRSSAPPLLRASQSNAQFLWWCDGPCGPAKAAVLAQSKESGISELAVPQAAGHLVSAIRTLAVQVKESRATGGILIVQYGAEAMVYTNRCPSLRAVLGTCFEAVEQGVQHVAANVLVIEYPYKSLSQVKNLLARFVKGKRELSEELRQRLKELANCV